MSWFVIREMHCPRCGALGQTRVADSLNAARLPEQRDDILAGRFHRFGCDVCGGSSPVDAAFLYSDSVRGQLVQVLPSSEQASWVLHEQAFDQQLEQAVQGPPFVQSLITTSRVRLVFGVDALAEKLRIWDADLNDIVVEAMKRSIAALLPRKPHELRMVAAQETSLRMQIWNEANVERASGELDVPRATYELLTKESEHATGRWVDWRRSSWR